MTLSHAASTVLPAAEFEADAWTSDQGHSDRPIDLVHLTRQTIGDKRLETELLRLFMRQSEQIQKALDGASEDLRGTTSSLELLHMLSGSARAVGAVRVAALAGRFESDLRRRDKVDLGIADRQMLRETVAEANAYVAGLLGNR